MEFSFGLEHEVAFFNRHGQFADFSQTNFADFDQIIQQLPIYSNDYPQLRVGDAGIKVKRWYIEGFERFENCETPTDCAPKGIEIRTTIHPSIQGAIGELSESFAKLRRAAAGFGFQPVLISYNPYHKTFKPMPPLNTYEHHRRESSPEKQTANIPMVTYGPDLSLSVAKMSTEQVIDVGKKLTYYSPYIIPFSFSSPFYGGSLWHGLSVRTHVRTGPRPAVMVFVNEPDKLLNSIPSLTKIARLPAEAGRLEFKAFDSCDDFSIYAGLMALLKGLVLDQSLSGRAVTPNASLHQLSAREGFENDEIFQTACNIFKAVESALAHNHDARLLKPLKNLLAKRETPAHKLIASFKRTGSIQQALLGTYQVETISR